MNMSKCVLVIFFMVLFSVVAFAVPNYSIDISMPDLEPDINGFITIDINNNGSTSEYFIEVKVNNVTFDKTSESLLDSGDKVHYDIGILLSTGKFVVEVFIVGKEYSYKDWNVLESYVTDYNIKGPEISIDKESGGCFMSLFDV